MSVATYRPYRFPPLDLFQKPAPTVSDASSGGQVTAEPDPQELAQAFEQAAQRGHAQGFEQGLSEGKQAGLAAGMEQGAAQGRAEVLKTLQEELHRLAQPLDAAVLKLQAVNADWQATLRKDVIDLVERVARQVVRCELTLQPAQILALVEETLEGMPRRTGEVHVFLHPADLQRIQELDTSRLPAWKLFADSQLESGECRLQVDDLEVDAGCKQRLSACMEQVRSQLDEVPEDAA